MVLYTFLGLHAEVELLDQVAALALILGGPSVLFSRTAPPIYVPTDSIRGLPNGATLPAVRRHLPMAGTGTSLLSRGEEHLIMLPPWLLWGQSSPLPISGSFVFLLVSCTGPIIIWKLTAYRIRGLQYFPPFQRRLFFHLGLVNPKSPQAFQCINKNNRRLSLGIPNAQGASPRLPQNTGTVLDYRQVNRPERSPTAPRGSSASVNEAPAARHAPAAVDSSSACAGGGHERSDSGPRGGC